MVRSKHAQARMQQRCIPPLILEWLHIYGEDAPASDGAVLRYFSKHSLAMIRSDIGRQMFNRVKPLLNTFAIVHEMNVITTGRLYKKVRK